MKRIVLAGMVPGLMITMAGCADEPVAAAPAVSSSQTVESVPAREDDDADSDGSLTEPGSAAGELGIGDPAPALSIAAWVQGKPVEKFTSEKVHVVEFWATWCGPCLASMPHIAELQTKYGDKVAFVGVTDEDAGTIEDFMKQRAGGADKTWSELLTYTIALDKEGATNVAYLEAAGQTGIPCAFVVGRSGRVEWIGHPGDIDDPLQQIVDGTWDLKQARSEFLAAKALEKAMEEAEPRVKVALQEGDYKAAVAVIDEVLVKFPKEERLLGFRLSLLLNGELNEEANKAAVALIDSVKDSGPKLNQIAWMMATVNEAPGLDLKIALSAAERALELSEGKEPAVLETLARLKFRMGDIQEAIQLQKKAIELAPEAESLKSGLEEFEDAARAAADGKSADAASSAPASSPAEDKAEDKKE